MNDPINIDSVKNSLIEIRGQKVLLDHVVAHIYGVPTKRINEAVKNNPEKFPRGYVIETNEDEFEDLRSKISSAKMSKTRTPPKAFPEKGLYMLATILKSKQATAATFNIIETFAQIRNFTYNIHTLHKQIDKQQQKDLLRKSGDILSDILEQDDPKHDSETSVEINFAIVKFKHTMRSRRVSAE